MLGSVVVASGVIDSVEDGAGAGDWLVGEVDVGERRERLDRVDGLVVVGVAVVVVESAGAVLIVSLCVDMVESGACEPGIVDWGADEDGIEPPVPGDVVDCASAGTDIVIAVASRMVFSIFNLLLPCYRCAKRIGRSAGKELVAHQP